MIALICEALVVGAAVVARGRGRARAEPAARGARRDAARDPPRDRRGGGARDRARDRRGDHDPDGLRRQDVRAQARSTALAFFFEPLRTLASAIVDYREGISSPALGAAVYAFALLLLFSAFVAVGGRLPGQAAAAQVPDTRMSTLSPHAPERRAAPRAAPGSAARTALLADELALGRPARARRAPGSPGISLCLIAAAIVLYMGYRGIQYLRPGLIFSRPAGERRPGRLGRLPGPADRDHAADRDRHRARAAARARERRVDRRVRAAELARARRRVEHRDRRRHARHRDRDLRARGLPARRCSRRSRSPPKAAACTAARSSPPAR